MRPLKINIFFLSFKDQWISGLYSLNPSDLMKKKSKYTPNEVPISTRVIFLFSGIGIIVYTIVGLTKGSLWVFGTRGKSMFLSSGPMWLMAIAFFLAASNILSDVVDHMDKRNNEARYVKYRAFSKTAAWIFFIAALVLNIYLFISNPIEN